MRSLQQANDIIFLDEKFRYMPLYETLKIFKEFSKVKQRDGSEC